MSTFEFISGQRNSQLLVKNGFIYNKYRMTNTNLKHFRCTVRKCPGKATIDENDNFTITDAHNHEAEIKKVEKLKFKNSVHERALNTFESPHHIVTGAISKIEDSSLCLYLPKLKSINDTVTKLRNKINGGLTINNTEFPDFLKYDCRGDAFLLFDTGIGSANRIVVFSSFFKKVFIPHITSIIIDGTFKSTPSGFLQTLIVHGLIFGRFYPLYYNLLTDKTEISYLSTFTKILPFFNNPSYIICDFEIALINAITKKFPGTKLNGCIFHFGQILWRNIQNRGFSVPYKNNINVKKAIKMLACLTFVPVNDVIKIFNLITQWITMNVDIDLSEFLDYFRKSFIGIFNDKYEIVTNPTYSVEFWNARERVLNDICRTTNSAESFHRTLNYRYNNPHPNIAYYINELLNEEEKDRYELIRATNGIFDLSGNLKKEKRLKIIISNYYVMLPFDFLKVIANCISFSFEISDD